MDYKNLSDAQLNSELKVLKEKLQGFKAQNLKLDMSRGKPCPEQLDISMDMLDCISSKDILKAQDGTDCRNYGAMDGIPETKQLFAQILEVSPESVLVGGSSSLNMMYDTISRAMHFGVAGSKEPWGKLSKVKFLCPSPGYDRHFAICELFGIEMVIIDMKKDGPDMDQVEKLVYDDASIKGIWCVPKYSNPEGITYSDEVVDRFAKMETKAEDFRIFWDNSYAVHHLTNDHDKLKNIMEACMTYGNADRVFGFTSSSKISFAGAGVAAMAASENNMKLIKKQMSIQTIGADKINMLRHARYFKDIDAVHSHMKKHAKIIAPKFETVLNILDEKLQGKNIAQWNKPKGGYFISLNTLDGCAKKVVAMAKDTGVTLTNAGATFPYGMDPMDRNIRIAPTFPSIEELAKAIEILCICIEIASIESLISGK